MSSLPSVRAAHQSHTEPATVTTLAAAQDRFTARSEEFRRKAGKYLGCGRDSRNDERVVDAMSLTWYRWVALVEANNATETNLTQAFYWSCKQVACGRVMPDDESSGSKTDPFRSRMQRHGIAMQPTPDYPMKTVDRLRHAIPLFDPADDVPELCNTGDDPADIAQYNIDTAAWFATLKPTDRDRVNELIAGWKTADLAAKHGVRPSAVSQWRQRYSDSYRSFLGD
jgi:hypothetical protein